MSPTEMEDRKSTVGTQVTTSALAVSMSRQQALFTVQTLQREQAIRFVNVQRLMQLERAVSLIRVIPAITPPETIPHITRAMYPILEEEELFTKRYIPKEVLEREEMRRPEEMRMEKRLEEVRKRILDPTAILMTDHSEFCLLEKYLWENLHDAVNAVLDKLILMTVAKQRWLERIPELEALEKLMLQLYIACFMGFPEQVNMLALRLSALTMQRLEHAPVAVYASATHQAQAMRTKAVLMTVQRRKQETKMVANERSMKELVPRKWKVAGFEDLTKDEMAVIARDMKGKAMFSIALRYCYGMPYVLRRWLAREYGLPENYKYIRYAKMFGIPIRRALWAWRSRRYVGESWTYFRRDQWIKNLRDFKSRYKSGRPYRGRYVRRGWAHATFTGRWIGYF